MKKFSAFLFALLFLALVAIPTVSASFTWTLLTENGSGITPNTGSTQDRFIQTIPGPSGTYTVVAQHSSDGFLYYETCQGFTCNAKSLINGATQAQYSAEPGFNGNPFLCTGNAGTSVSFQQSIGGFWTTPVTIDATTAGGAFCDVAPVSSTIAIAAYHNDATTLQWSKTTDSGSTWSTGANIDTGLEPKYISLAATSATNWTVAYGDQTTLKTCYTTNTGSTWTCQQLSASASFGTLAKMSGSTLLIGYINPATGALGVYRSTNGGANWAAGPTPASGFTATTGTRIGFSSKNGTVAAFAVLDADATHPSKLVYTRDTGNTWASDTVAASPNAAVRGAAVAFLSEGSVAVTLAYASTTLKNYMATFSAAAQADAVTAAFPSGKSLLSFDVDPSGNKLIARIWDQNPTPDQSDTFLYNANPLDPLLDSAATCLLQRGILADRQAVAYVAGSGVGQNPCVAHSLLIRGPNDLDAYANPYGCEDCPDDITLESVSGHDFDISEIVKYPIDETNFHNFGLFQTSSSPHCNLDVATGTDNSCTRARVAFGQSTEAGDLGITTFTYREGQGVSFHNVLTHFASSTPNQICTTTRPSDGATLMGAVAFDVNTVMVQIKFTEAPDNSDLTASFGTPSGAEGWNSATMGNAKGISCSPTITVISQNDKIWEVNTATGAVIHSFNVENTLAQQPAVVSQDGKFFAYWDAGAVKLYNVTSDSLASCTLTPPAGFFIGMDMDDTAQNIWLGGESGIKRYLLAGSDKCNVTPQVAGGGDHAPPTSTEPSNPLFDPGVNSAVSNGIFRDRSSGLAWSGLLLTVFTGVLMGGAKVTVTRNPKDYSILLAAIGLVLGFFLAWIAFHLFPDKVGYSILVLALVAIGVKIWIKTKSGRGG